MTIYSTSNDRAKFFWLCVFPPVFFVAISWLRCYVETALLSHPPFFGYYIGLHHILWMVTIILIIILLAHLILNVPVKNLIWFMYGGLFMLIPVLYALLSGNSLDMNYLRGSFVQIATHIFTFCATYSYNHPLTIELVCIFLCMAGIGYVYTRDWRRAIGLAVAVHITGCLLAIEWFGTGVHCKAIFAVSTRLTNHPFLAIVFLHTVTFLVIALMWHAGQFIRCRRAILISAGIAISVWIVCAITVYYTGWFEYAFDCISAGLPFATAAFIITLFAQRSRSRLSAWTWLCLCVLVVLQLAVFMPIFLHMESRLNPFLYPPYTNGAAG